MEKPGEYISPAEFDVMKERYEKHVGPTATKSVLFSADSIKSLLKDGVKAIRIYFGADEEQRTTVMLRPEGNESAVADEETILDRGQLCPPYCGEK